MNKIVREHYPVHNLPADLRAGMAADATVTVTVIMESDAPPFRLLEAMDASDRPRRSRADIDQLIDMIRSDETTR
jgi:hypothetical protein